MRLVLADVEPLAIIVGWTPRPVLVDGHEPGVIALTELCQRFRTDLLEDVQVIVSVVTLDRFPAGIPRPALTLLVLTVVAPAQTVQSNPKDQTARANSVSLSIKPYHPNSYFETAWRTE